MLCTALAALRKVGPGRIPCRGSTIAWVLTASRCNTAPHAWLVSRMGPFMEFLSPNLVIQGSTQYPLAHVWCLDVVVPGCMYPTATQEDLSQKAHTRLLAQHSLHHLDQICLCCPAHIYPLVLPIVSGPTHFPNLPTWLAAAPCVCESPAWGPGAHIEYNIQLFVYTLRHSKAGKHELVAPMFKAKVVSRGATVSTPCMHPEYAPQDLCVALLSYLSCKL